MAAWIQARSAAAIYSVSLLTEERQGDYSGLVNRFPGDPNVLLYNPFTTRFDADGNSIRDRVVNNDLRTTGMINQTALAADQRYLPDIERIRQSEQPRRSAQPQGCLEADQLQLAH